MNPSMKQHRHPGLWSLPENDSSSLCKATVTSVNAQHPAVQEVTCQPHWHELTQLRQVLDSNGAFSTHENRWITLIGQPRDASVSEVRKALRQAGIDAKKVRWIRPSDSASKAWAAEQACLLDNSAVIVAWLGECQQRDARRLQLARKHTAAQVLLFDNFSNMTPLH